MTLRPSEANHRHVDVLLRMVFYYPLEAQSEWTPPPNRDEQKPSFVAQGVTAAVVARGGTEFW